MPVSIRAAGPKDLPALKSLWQRFNAYLDTIDEPEHIDPALFSRFEALCFGPDAICCALLAEHDGTPAGYAIYFWGVRMESVTASLHIADIFVDEAVRGTGAGRVFMDHIREMARQRGAGQVIWNVWDKNASAIAFYKRIGAQHLEQELQMIWPVDQPRAGSGV